MNKKAIGCILMILGTTVGAAMLALPIVTAYESFAMSMLLLISGWVLMTIGAFSLLEVNLWLKPRTNMISMANKTLGKMGMAVTWVVYLLLLYSLISAYLSGLSDVTQSLLANISINIPRWAATFLGLGLFGSIVYRGIGSVDIVNRGLMSLKLLAYFILVTMVASHIDIDMTLSGDYEWRNSAFMVVLTSFGYAIIVPSIRDYLDNDHKLLKKVVLIGSLLPLFIYALWVFTVHGVIAKTGETGLISMLSSSQSNSMLMNNLSQVTDSAWVSAIVKFFISICAVTSFLGVSICLTDFIADGISVEKTGKQGLIVYAISYLPPLVMVLVSPGIFIKALDYGGTLCLILLVIIPLLMLYFGRYKHNLLEHQLLPGKAFILIALIVVCSILVVNTVYAVLV